MPSRGSCLAAGAARAPRGLQQDLCLELLHPQDLGPTVEPLKGVALLGTVLDLGLEQPWCGEGGAAQRALVATLEQAGT